MVNKKTTIILSVCMLIVIGAVIGFSLTSRAITANTIDIGAIFMLTGTGATWGINSQRGVELAVEEINDNGGVNGRQIRVVYEDNQGDNPKIAVTALHKLSNQGINIILGPNWSPSGNAVAPIACEKGIVMISPSLGVADFNEECDFLFNLWPHDDVSSEKLGEYLYEKGYKKIAVLGSLQVWEQTQAYAVKKGFEGKGGKVVSFILTQPEETDFGGEVVKIKNVDPDAIVFTNYAGEHISAKRLREINVQVPFFSILIDDEKIKSAQGALEDAIIITSFTPSEKFMNKFKEKYKEQPDIGSDTSYDAVMLLAQAMRETQSTNPEILKKYMNGLKKYEGTSGRLVFDRKGGVTKEPELMIVKEGKLIPFE